MEAQLTSGCITPRKWLVATAISSAENTCNKHGLRPINRKRKMSDKRQFFCWFLVRKLGLTTLRTAEIVNRHHSTILYGNNVVDSHFDTKDSQFFENVKQIKRELELLV